MTIETMSKASVDSALRDSQSRPVTRYSVVYMHAICSGGAAEMHTLLQHPDFEIENRDHYGFTVLQTVSMGHHPESVLVLLKAGADVEAVDKWGNTSLHLAISSIQDRCYTGDPFEEPASSAEQVVKDLCSYGSDIHAQNNQAETPLHKAARAGEPEVVTYLLEKGAYTDLLLKSTTGYQPYDLCLANTEQWIPCENTPHCLRRLQQKRHKDTLLLLRRMTRSSFRCTTLESSA
jgi:ankyrin repeat protein